MNALRIVYIFLALMCAGLSACAQTNTSFDSITARYRFRLNGKDMRSIVETINGSSTHNQLPTAKSVYDLVGPGDISDFISTGLGNPPAALASDNDAETWRNMTTGELWRSDGTNWILFLSGTGDKGDISVTSSILYEINNNAVGASELAATAVTAGSYGSGTQVGTFTVDADGRLTAAANVAITAGGTNYQTLRDDGTGMTQQPALNFVSSSTVNAVLTNDGAGGETEASFNVPTDGITDTQIAANAVGTSEIATDGVDAAEIAANAVGASELAATAVPAGSYGSGTQVGTFTVDADGRLTAAANVAITAGANYQTLRDDGTGMTQQPALNFVSSSTVNAVLTNDGAGGETEVSLTVPTDGITATEIAAGAVGTSEIATDGVDAAEIAANAVGTSELAATAVPAGSYGSGTQVGTFTVDADGRLTAAANVAITAGGTNYQTMKDEGVAVTARANLNLLQTATINITLNDDAGNNETELTAVVRNNSITDFEIAANAIGTDELAVASVMEENLDQMGATAGQAMIWNGTVWASEDPTTVQDFTSSGTFTVATGTKTLEIVCVGGGGGGGSGRKGAAASVRGGGGGGSSGATSLGFFSISTLGSPATVTITVGAGGTGGAGVTANSTDGNPGTDGGESSCSISGTKFIRAEGGKLGAAGTTVGGAGGGPPTIGDFFPVVVAGAGGGGGAGQNATDTGNKCGGSGGGGGGVTAGNVASAGGSGSAGYHALTATAAGGGAGVAGTAGAAPAIDQYTGSGGGGGGGKTAAGGTAGAGGGGGRGAGGGGGGAGVNSTNDSGAGGAGGGGWIRIIAHY